MPEIQIHNSIKQKGPSSGSCEASAYQLVSICKNRITGSTREQSRTTDMVKKNTSHPNSN